MRALCDLHSGLYRLAKGLAAALLLATGAAQAIPALQTWETTQGAKVLFVPAPELPILDVKVVFDAGSARERGPEGVAKLANNLLLQGAGEWNADVIAERLDAVGAQLDSEALRDMATVSLRVLAEARPMSVALETFAACLSTPHFAALDLERVRQQTLVSLEQERQNPGEMAKRAFFTQLYAGHPYGRWPLGNEESIRALTTEHLREHHREFYVAANAIVAIVGAVDRPGAERIAEDLMRGLPRGQHAPALPVLEAPKQSQEVPVAFPSQQTHWLIGQTALQRNDPDYFPIHVGNHILGGSGLVSLLAEEVREKRGLSYSVYSSLLPMRAQGPFILGLQTKNTQADQASEVLMNTLKQFVAQGPTDQQLQEAKANLSGGFPMQLASNRKVLDQIAVIGFYDLPLDYLDRYVSRILDVTAEQVREAFQRRIHPDALLRVRVGGQGAAAPAG